ncbi:hypothetical protein [Fulvivirga sedimenti]|uniref:Uncharacterized protein n=1 Tax=Fulvivirga sedimenti TaxID=2879465 RepID=A0A9X1HNJ3_9BACT|nr:hypothetical protein [Fulvivirga sedimenti]MCA6073252.1 hypothetical protein [Fulvivirga sedimenti]
MENIYKPIGITTLILLFYLISVFTNLAFGVVFILFVILNIFTIWMVIRILKDGKPSDKSFDECWYEDYKV